MRTPSPSSSRPPRQPVHAASSSTGYPDLTEDLHLHRGSAAQPVQRAVKVNGERARSMTPLIIALQLRARDVALPACRVNAIYLREKGDSRVDPTPDQASMPRYNDYVHVPRRRLGLAVFSELQPDPIRIAVPPAETNDPLGDVDPPDHRDTCAYAQTARRQPGAGGGDALSALRSCPAQSSRAGAPSHHDHVRVRLRTQSSAQRGRLQFQWADTEAAFETARRGRAVIAAHSSQRAEHGRPDREVAIDMAQIAVGTDVALRTR